MPDKENVAYVEMTEAQGDARYGKMEKGRVMMVSPEEAERWTRLGIAKNSSKSAFDRWNDKRNDVGDRRAAAINALNETDAAYWDVNYRDAVHARPDNLRTGMDAGMMPVNLGSLTDEDGLPLPVDATFEDIMEARKRLQHPDADPIYGHTQASTSGGGSHYYTPVPEEQIEAREEILDTTQTSKRRTGRLMPGQQGNAPEPADTTGSTLHGKAPLNRPEEKK